MFSQLREVVAKFQYPCVNGLSLLLFWYKIWTRLKKWHTFLTDFGSKVTDSWVLRDSLSSSFFQPL